MFGQAFSVDECLIHAVSLFLVARFASVLLIPWVLHFQLAALKLRLDFLALIATLLIAWWGSRISSLALIALCKAVIEMTVILCLVFLIRSRLKIARSERGLTRPFDGVGLRS